MTSTLTHAALEQAISNNELVLYYQPKVCLLRGHVIGAEALVRWQGLNDEIVSPDQFLPFAEQAGLLHDITIKLLEQVVAAIQALHQVDTDLSVSINVAPNDLESHTISDQIKQYLDRAIIQPDDLQIEITESAAMGNFNRIQEDLRRIKSMGLKILMDDFGTGYSSVDRLSQLPFTSLKLDQGVVKRMGTSRQNLNVVKSSISMARELGMTSVAEGIESAGAYNFLIANGCEEAQGYFIGKPMALDDYLGFVAAPPDFAGSQIGRVHQAVYNVLYDRKCLIDAAYCHQLHTEESLPSVTDTGLADNPHDSRLGLWYYGIGQALSHRRSFQAIEAPLLALHEASMHVMDILNKPVSNAVLDPLLTDMDRQTDALVSQLHVLERELLFVT